MGSLLWLAVAYVMGSIPFGLLFAKMFCGTDPRTGGSRNVGATNVARLCGTKVGVLTLVCDALKGAIPVAVALSISDSTVFHSLTALAALLGHLYSCFLSFKGGKAVATTVGVFLPLAFWPLVLSGIACLAVIWRSGFVSLGSLTLVTAMPAMLLLGGHWKLVPLALVVMVLVYWSHRENIGRLSRGEEKPWQKKHHDAAQGTDAGAAPEAAADAAHAGTVDCGCDCGCDPQKPHRHKRRPTPPRTGPKPPSLPMKATSARTRSTTTPPKPARPKASQRTSLRAKRSASLSAGPGQSLPASLRAKRVARLRTSPQANRANRPASRPAAARPEVRQALRAPLRAPALEATRRPPQDRCAAVRQHTLRSKPCPPVIFPAGAAGWNMSASDAGHGTP